MELARLLAAAPLVALLSACSAAECPRQQPRFPGQGQDGCRPPVTCRQLEKVSETRSYKARILSYRYAHLYRSSIQVLSIDGT